MIYDEILDDYLVSLDDIELFKTDGLFNSIIEGFNGRYEYYEDSDKAEWEITVSTNAVDKITNKYTIEKVVEQCDNSIRGCLKAFVNDNAIEVCEGQVNEFRLSTNDLRMLLPVVVEINTENNSINLCPIYFN